MEEYTVSFFGDQQQTSRPTLIGRLEEIAAQLILTQKYVHFYTSLKYSFDMLSAAAVRRVTSRLGRDNSLLTLMLPFPDPELFEENELLSAYYDNVEIYSGRRILNPKRGYEACCQRMAKRSDMVVICSEHDYGNIHMLYEYVKTLQIRIINLGARY